MTFDRINKRSKHMVTDLVHEDASFNEEDLAERQDMLEKLRDQIRAGTYRPSIGEIAIKLVRDSGNPEIIR